MITLLVSRLINCYEVIIVVACIMTWLPPTSSSLVEDIRGALHMLTEPYLSLFRPLPLRAAGIDFTPVVATLALEVIRNILLSLF